MTNTYSAPQVRSLGTIEEMTQQSSLNKVGASNDAFTAAIQAAIGQTIVGEPQDAPKTR